MSRFALKRRAEIDLEGIWRYSAGTWSAGQADQYVARLWNGIRLVAADPNRGRPCPEVKAGYCRHAVGSHVIFYRMTATGIEVVRILHQRMDFRRHV
jgi:toxin ParE1/3/4